MRARAALPPAAALLLMVACSDPREAELTQEIAALKEARVPKASYDVLLGEVAASESSLGDFGPQLEDLHARIEEAQRGAAALEAALQAEIARNQKLNAEIQDGQKRVEDATARQAELEQQITIARARAQTFKDQAAALSRELRPDDPDWARRLRIQTLREFLGEVARTWPGDPVLAGAGRSTLPTDEREATRVGAELAARIRDRVSEVYSLGEAAAASEPASVASPPPPAS